MNTKDEAKFSGKRRAWRGPQARSRHSERPRLCVVRSLKHMYAQLIDDARASTLASAGHDRSRRCKGK